MFGIYMFHTLLRPMAPMMSPFSRCIVNLGGVEHIALLLKVARFDRNNDDELDEAEEANATKEAEKAIADAMTNYTNTAVVAALLFGATHVVTIARPGPLKASDIFLDHYSSDAGLYLTYWAYGANALCECSAVTALFLSFFYRNMLAMVLPSLAAKLRFLMNSNATGSLVNCVTGMLLSLWATATLCAILGQPTYGWTAVGFLGTAMSLFLVHVVQFMLDFPLELHEVARSSGLLKTSVGSADGAAVSDAV